ncbi:LysE family translocator [Shivajiella indica]|uniref:LysE family translocator n=1 Tax=Shivajiella indica TaxID=872115 RepID=A0ABW5B9X9_9BACT
MNQAFLEGFSMGLLLSAMIGPVFFTLIQSSLEKGFRYATILALGILISDLLYVLITYFGVSFLAKFPNFQFILAIGGGIVLVGFGISTFIKKNKERPNTGGVPVLKGQKRSAFFKGFSINGINPFVLLFWLSVAGLVSINEQYSKPDVVFYYTGILATVFSIDLLKSFVAKQLRNFVTPKLMGKLNKLVGIALFFFGLRLFWFAFK